MKLGFIGTGEITKALVIGILGSKIKFKKIYLSKRNSKISAFLTKKSKKIQIEKNNQHLINKSDWVFLAVTPKVGNQIIRKLNFKKIKPVDVLVGGFPCQAFSVAGYRKGFRDPRGNLFYEIIRIIKFNNSSNSS